MVAPLIGAALIGGGSSLLGSAMSMFGSGSDEDAILKATQASIDAELEMLLQGRRDVAPWREAGVWSLGRMVGPQNLTGVPSSELSRIANEYQSFNIAKPKSPVPSYHDNKNIWRDDAQARNYFQKWESEFRKMMPTGLDLKDIPSWKNWLLNPYPVDAYGNPIDTSILENVRTGTPQQGILGQGPPQFSFEEYAKSPYYQFPLEEGVKAIERSASARGLRLSPTTDKNLMRWASDYAYGKYADARTRQFNEWLTGTVNPLQAVAGLGQTPALQMSTNAMNAGETIAKLQQTAGINVGSALQNKYNALAGGILGAGSAVNTGIGNYMNYNLMRNILNQGNMSPLSVLPTASGSGGNALTTIGRTGYISMPQISTIGGTGYIPKQQIPTLGGTGYLSLS